MAISFDAFMNLSWQDKMNAMAKDPELLDSEKIRASGKYSTTGSEDSKAYLSMLNAIGAGVNPTNVASGNYDKAKYEWFPTPDSSQGVAVRQTLVDNYGLDNSQIGWVSDELGGGFVTYGGASMAKPDKTVNGVSYMDSTAGVKDMAIKAYQSKGIEPVKVSEYLASKGLPISLSGDGKTVSVGGIMVKALFSEDGKSYADKAELDKAIAAYSRSSGIAKGSDISSKYANKYDTKISSLVNNMMHGEKFEYKPENDQSFQSYKNQYNREGDRAMRNAMGAGAGITGGYVNSAAVTAGAQQRQYWSDKLMDKLPELEAAAFDRYLSGLERDAELLKQLQALQKQEFDMEYGANRDMIEDAYNERAYQDGRYQTTFDNGMTEKAHQLNVDKFISGEKQAVFENDLAIQKFDFQKLVNDQSYSLDLQKFDLEKEESYYKVCLDRIEGMMKFAQDTGQLTPQMKQSLQAWFGISDIGDVDYAWLEKLKSSLQAQLIRVKAAEDENLANVKAANDENLIKVRSWYK